MQSVLRGLALVALLTAACGLGIVLGDRAGGDPAPARPVATVTEDQAPPVEEPRRLEDFAAVAEVVGGIVVVVSLLQVARSNRRLGASLRMGAMQQMIGELNQLRRTRMDLPELERSLFTARERWSDVEIQRNLTAVQFANIFEWAYFARREGLLADDVWRSWVDTWHSVIMSSPAMKAAFVSSVWTFAREEPAKSDLDRLVFDSAAIADPYLTRRRNARLPGLRTRLAHGPALSDGSRTRDAPPRG